MTRAARLQAALLPDGRLHLNDGPIDLVIGVTAPPAARQRAYEAARGRLDGLLDALCDELAALRAPADPRRLFTHPVAWRMAAGVAPYAGSFITPMAAVAGAVAEDILAAIVAAAPLARAYVNNGGDIAFHLGDGERFDIGLVASPDHPQLLGTTTIDAAMPVRGIATSGWRGRSFSLGIADAVTVLAARAADADAAATIIANAVDLPGHPAVTRVQACDVQPDSDLGARLVTGGVGPLTQGEIETALARGVAQAEKLVQAGTIVAASLHLAGKTNIVGETLSRWERVAAKRPGKGLRTLLPKHPLRAHA